MRVPAAGAIVACVLVATACSSHDTTQEVRPAPKPRTGSATSTVSPTTHAPTTSSTVPRRPTAAYAARARNSTIAVYPAPATHVPPQVLPSPWVVDPTQPEVKVPQVFLVQASKFVPGWLRVLLPVQPNGTAGWVRSRDVTIEQITYHVLVDLSAHRITVSNGNNVVYRGPVAVGKASTPTPTGKYYVRALTRAPNPKAAYGPYAFGLSSRSPEISTFIGADNEIGIHGNRDASALGRSVTGGSIRMDNRAISRLAGMLPIGTPVDVVA